MRILFYFLAFLFIACVACDSKDEPETPPAPPKPPTPISPRDSIYNLLEGFWDIDSVETFHYGVTTSAIFEYVLIDHYNIKYTGNEQLKLDNGGFRKKDSETEFKYLPRFSYGMKGDTAYVYSYEHASSVYGGYTTYHYSNRRARIYKTEIIEGLYYKDSIISIHRKTKGLPK